MRFQNLLEVYALGALEGEEREALNMHLAVGCPACEAALAGARALVAQLAWAAPPAEPPERLRLRLLAAARRP